MLGRRTNDSHLVASFNKLAKVGQCDHMGMAPPNQYKMFCHGHLLLSETSFGVIRSESNEKHQVPLGLHHSESFSA